MYTNNLREPKQRLNDLQLKAIKAKLSKYNVSEVSNYAFKSDKPLGDCDIVLVKFSFAGVSLSAADITNYLLFDLVDPTLDKTIKVLKKEIEQYQTLFTEAIEDPSENIDLLLSFVKNQSRHLDHSCLNPTLNSHIIDFASELYKNGHNKNEIFVETMDFIYKNANKMDILVNSLDLKSLYYKTSRN